MAIGDNFKCSVIGQTNEGTAIVFDFGYADLAGGSSHLDTGILAGNFQTLVQAKMALCLPDTFNFHRYRAACVHGPHIGEIGYVAVDPLVPGSVGDSPLPPEVCISLKRATGYASRRDRGRIFFGPVDHTFQNETVPDFVTINDDLRAVRDLLKANLVSGGVTLTPVILSADGTFTAGHTIQRVEIGPEFTHRKSRRTRAGA